MISCFQKIKNNPELGATYANMLYHHLEEKIDFNKGLIKKINLVKIKED